MMTGTIINVAAIVGGTAVGLLVRKGIPETVKNTVMQGIGMAVVIIGIKMALKTQNELVLIGSLVLGAIIGQMIGIDEALERFGRWINRMVGDRFGDVGKGFVFASLVYCVGAMAIVGAIKDGLTGDASILYAKSILDGVSAIVFASTLGIGVGMSAVSVLIYQGAITIVAMFVGNFASEAMIAEMTAVGGVLIMGIGITMLEIKRIVVANLLPGIIIAAVLALVIK